MIRRSKLEVFMDIMKVVAEEREMKRTRIMYKANLAWTVLNDALDSMEKKGILEKQGDSLWRRRDPNPRRSEPPEEIPRSGVSLHGADHQRGRAHLPDAQNGNPALNTRKKPLRATVFLGP